MVDSSIDIIKAAQAALKKNMYSYKKDLIIVGYSFGGYTAINLSKELETSTTLPVCLTIMGGVSMDLIDMVNSARLKTTLSSPYIYPQAVFAYDKFENKTISISDIFKAPIDKAYLANAFDGTRNVSELEKYFSTKTSDLFTNEMISDFDNNPKYENVRSLLVKNSVEAWKNKNRLVIVHGMNDEVVDYKAAKDFYDKQKNLGGNIIFSPIPFGEHISTMVPFYLEMCFWMGAYR
jgi:predicted alpha/beta hydrolase family esterase